MIVAATVGNVLEWRLHTHLGEEIVAFHETFALVGTITAFAVLAAIRMGPRAKVLAA